jgi:hypothetical protein
MHSLEEVNYTMRELLHPSEAAVLTPLEIISDNSGWSHSPTRTVAPCL